MSVAPSSDAVPLKQPWYRSIGPALITACVVFGPGSLVISANVGATYGYELLWLLVLAGLMMGTFMTMSARMGVTAGKTHFAVLAQEAGRPYAALLGAVLCITCASFQFSNNLAIALIAGAFAPEQHVAVVQIAVMASLNGFLIIVLFRARELFNNIERIMKVMVGIVLTCFLVNLFMAQPSISGILKGLAPGIPEGLSLGIPRVIAGTIQDPLVLIASLMGTTFSVAGAFFQGNLVREKGWNKEDYERGIGDSIAGVCILTLVSAMIMITAGSVIRDQPADNIATLAMTLRPLLGSAAFIIFCIGLFPVALNPFLINAMIGGTALADGFGLPGRINDRWPRVFTVGVLITGFVMASIGLINRIPPVNLMVFGQAMTVIGNPLMAGTLLWMANSKKVMGERRNGWGANALGALGFTIVLLLAVRMIWFLYLRITLMTN